MIKVEKPSDSTIEAMGISDWPVWEKEKTKFSWQYDKDEICYIIKGRAEVIMLDGESVEFSEGDLITFPAGLKCLWIIKEDIQKHYFFP